MSTESVPPVPGEAQFLTLREAAELVRLSPKTLLNLRARGLGPRSMPGSPGKLVFERSEMIAWLAAPRKPARARRRKPAAALAPAV